MEIAVLAASGATGLELTRQAVDRGHRVIAISRDPSRVTVPDSAQLTKVAADIRDPDSLSRALQDKPTVLSGLGVAKGERPGVLTLGAEALVRARVQRIIWLGAFGTGESATAAGFLTTALLKVFLRAELEDKVTSDARVLAAGGTVFHCGPLSDGPVSGSRRSVALQQVPRRVLPARISRATVAAAMLDEAESALFVGKTVVPLER